jgi:hypothetical protein
MKMWFTFLTDMFYQLLLKSQTRYFSAGTIICNSQEKANGIFVITAGQVFLCSILFKCSWMLYSQDPGGRLQQSCLWILRRQTRQTKTERALSSTSSATGNLLQHAKPKKLTSDEISSQDDA